MWLLRYLGKRIGSTLNAVLGTLKAKPHRPKEQNMTDITIGFIGAGNMASSIVGGLLAKGIAANNIWLNDIDEERLNSLAQELGVNITLDYNDIVPKCDILVLAVKPQTMAEACATIKPLLSTPAPVVLSIAAGITVASLQQWLGQVPVVRVMPNTPALVQAAASGLYASNEVSPKQKQQAESLINSVGKSVWLDQENLMDAVTAVSGSGPAYFFLLMESMIDSAKQLGLDDATAKTLVLQTALGAAKLADQSEESPQILRERVTSPGGTTAAALHTFHQGGFSELVHQALSSAKQRSEELA